MAIEHKPLTVYRIRDSIDGAPVRDFADVIVETNPEDPDELTSFVLTSQPGFEAQLFVARPKIKHPPWQEFLEEGFGDLDAVLADAVSNSAVLIVKLKKEGGGSTQDQFFAFTFGFGRYLLKRNSYRPSYGLRVALNTIYKRGSAAASRVRSVDAKTVAANTIHTRRQAARRANFEAFEVDVQRDFLRAITGQPVDLEDWGTRVTGADALNVDRAVTFDELGDLCGKIERLYQQDDWRERFSWVENVRAVDVQHRAELEARLLEKLKQRDLVNLDLAPPALVEWDEIAGFRFSVFPEKEYPDLVLGDYVDALAEAQRLEGLTIRQLRTRHKLEIVDTEGELLARWPVFTCLSGEFAVDGKTYLVDDGDFFEVAVDYMEELDRYVGQLAESGKPLPPSVGDIAEGMYNVLAANSSADYLLLDKRTVRVTNKTSPIEICDVLTTDGDFIHVKRKLGSSSLSHLFGQGSVSADLLLMSQEYRDKVHSEIRKAEKDRVQETEDPSFVGRFSAFDSETVSPGDYEVVYAIIAKWDRRDFVQALPFFSKVNLRKHCNDLRRMGYRVSYKRVHVTHYHTQVDRMVPEVPDLTIQGTKSADGRISLKNGTGKVIHLLDQDGVRVVRIDAKGEVFNWDAEGEAWKPEENGADATYGHPPVSHSGSPPEERETVVSTWVVSGQIGDAPFEIHGQTVYR